MRKNLLLGLVGIAIAFAGALLLVDIVEKRSEARNPFFRVTELTDTTESAAIWGQNFPYQYDGYLRTVDMERTRHGGSESVLRDPTGDDPREVTSQSKLDHLPALRRMWAGYAFARDFREERGHAYMLEDQIFTGRQAVPQPGTCLNCHASMVVPWLKAGDGDLERGFELLNPLPYDSARAEVSHPISCIDCHEPETMQLRVTRPGFIDGIRALKASQGIPDFEVNRDASHAEMRNYVCGQCHVEYYFRGSDKRLTFPWARGTSVDSIYAYYEAEGFKDWTHAETGAPMLKAQHPEFEMFSQGTHASAGVTCADCHMPYRRLGAQKVSDHQVRSPLLDVNASCATCHRDSEAALLARAETIQDRHARLRDRALAALVDLIDDIVAAQDAGMADARLDRAREFQRKASFYVDFVEAENSTGFHADQEGARILGEAIDAARLGQRVLNELR
ncbi:MAG: ammonia-forming cytochrome c nitrite reductase subunit c552 [Rhodothermales bacterium]|nr:ammonia-forming cytochrome c nitrite reductase subunit c552 [Rhodothermales bacterium]MBO6781148.1 ammonia-forming cytochrome c nitrite reductase subunit c552 [Rhodothermales bacterium]